MPAHRSHGSRWPTSRHRGDSRPFRIPGSRRLLLSFLLLLLGAAGTALAAALRGGEGAPPPAGSLSAAPADTVPVFGPRRFEPGAGRAALHVERFAAPGAANGGYLLRVVDGDGRGNGRVSALSLRVNGAEVATAASLGHAGGRLDVPVALLAQNTIEASVEGPAGSGVSVVVLQVPERSFTVFGPRTVRRAAGTPVVVTERFALPPGAAPPYRLEVLNGAPDGTGRAPSATLRVNGAQAVGPADLSRSVGALLRDVSLAAENTVEVEIRGAPGVHLTWRVTAMDGDAPRIVLAAPAPGLVTREAAVEVSGTVEDPTPVHVTVNGVDAARSGAGFRATAPLSAEGENTITVSATDAAGNRTDSVRTVVRDTEAPRLSIVSPADGGGVADSVVEVRGTVHDRTGVQANVNGVPVTLDASGAFAVRVPVDEGVNFLTLAATDAAGNGATLVRQTVRDGRAPELAVTSPAEGLVTSAATVTVTGTVTDVSPVTVTVNGVVAAVDAGSFRAEVALAEDGPVALRIEAADAAGNRTEAVRTITRDTRAPSLTLAAPAEGLVTREASVALSGRVEDATAVTLTLGGAPIAVGSDGAFTATAPLPADGPAALALVATDAAGNRAELARTVVRDTQPPALALASPAEGLTTRDGQVVVEGTATDATALALTVGGAAATVAEGGAFRVETALAEGENRVVVRATDAAGNAAELTRKVVRDSEAPAIEVVSPSGVAVVRTAALTVTGRVRDSGTVRLTVGGVEVPVGDDGAFTATVTLSEGTNAIALLAADAAGNESQASVSVVLDTQAPVFAALTPADGVVVRDEAAVVTGRVTDATTVSVRVNGVPATVGADGSFQASVALAEGETSVVVTLADAAGNEASAIVRIVRDSQPPVITVASPAEGTTTEAGNVAISGRVQDATTVTLTMNGSAVQLAADGAFSFEAPLTTGANAFAFEARDAAGNTATLTRTVTREEEDAGVGLPPEPSRVATPIDPTVATHLGEATAFLYSGASPIQTGVAPGTIEPERTAVLRGRVLTRDGAPLSGVRVSVRGHPEYGQTLSRRDGAYDLALNGGAEATLDFEKEGYLPAQRGVPTTWMEFAGVEDVALVPLDARVTAVALSASTAEAQVARGSVVSDADGPRQATVLFPAGTEAVLEMPDGTTRPVGSLSIRLTEYTVGAGGPTAMPGELPPTSAYTYAVEVSADEAIAAGAGHARFSKPVSFYVDNFLEFPVGGAVPVAYYDRGKAAWVPMDDGRIIRVLPGGGAMAAVDADGDGVADGEAALAALGIDAAERAGLARTYPDGASLWRVRTTHLTPFDLNWPSGPAGPFASRPPPRRRPPPEECNGRRSGSVIECESRVLGERITVTGTGLTLNYRSDRVVGRGNETVIPLVGDTADMLRVEVTASVAGRSFRQVFEPTPGLSWTFRWDGLDAYGRRPQGLQTVRVRRTYVYPNYYFVPAAQARSFGFACTAGTGERADRQACIIPTTLNERARQEVTGSDEFTFEVNQWDGRQGTVAGWSLSEHHVYDPTSRRLYEGTGERRTASRVGQIIETIAGNGDGGYEARDGQALELPLGDAGPLAVAADGTVYVSGWEYTWLARITREGRLEHVAGQEFSRCRAFPCGDGGPVAQAQFADGIEDLKFGPDGSLYIADGRRIRKVSPDGIITTVAGQWDGWVRDIPEDYPSGDGGPATQARIGYAWGVSVARDGTVYFVDSGNWVPITRVRKVTPDGVIHTVAGGRPYTGEDAACRAEGIRATDACLDFATDVDVAPDGTVYVLEPYNRLMKVNPDGTFERVAGSEALSCWGTDDGVHALETGLCGWRMERHPDGRIFFDDQAGAGFYADSVNWEGYVDNSYRMRAIGLDGIVTTVFGGNGWCRSWIDARCGDGGLARRATIGTIPGLAFGPDGSMYLGDIDIGRVRRVGLPFPGFSEDASLVASSDGSEVYELDGGGRHVRTRDARSGAVRLAFGYDGEGRVASVTDANGGVTRIERDGAGRVRALVAPGGERTELEENADGYLARVTNPAGETVRVEYRGAGGLMTGLTDARGGRHRYAYDAVGRLELDADPAEGFQGVAGFATRCGSDGRCDEGAGARATTALGRTTTYWSQRLDAGGVLREMTSPTGLAWSVRTDDRGFTVTRTPDGMRTWSLAAADPRFGMDVPYAESIEIHTPGGLRLVTTASRHVVRGDLSNPFGIRSQTDSLVVNDRATVTTWEAATGRTTIVSPEGRQRSVTKDSLGRLVEVRPAGGLPIRFEPDALGRMARVRNGDRTWRYDYDARGRLQSIHYPVGSTTLAYDSAGRVTSTVLPGGREVGFDWDAAGNRTGVRPAGRPTHAFAYDSAGRMTAYTLPAVDGVSAVTRWRYDADGAVERVLRPEGDAVEYSYDDEGRVEEVLFSGTGVGYRYDSATGQLRSATGYGRGALTYGYDGALPTSTTWSGAVSGSVSHAFDNDFRVAEERVNGGHEVDFRYDEDGLLVGVGGLTLARAADSGWLTGTEAGGVSTTLAYDSLGQVAGIAARYGTQTLYEARHQRDAAGRVERLVERVGADSVVFLYGYDVAGRLASVERDGVAQAAYEYDANGNRLRAVTAGGVADAEYDAQDRLRRLGGATFGYTAGGDLAFRAVGADTTRYTYDAFGNLTEVALPAGKRVEYLADPANRRVGKRVDGALVQGFLYGSGTSPVAELDGQGRVVSRFVYGSLPNVPDLMVRGGVTYRIVTDRLGSVRAVVNAATGEVAQRIEYDAFGTVTLDTRPGFQPFGFAGGLSDGEVGLVRFGARDYDPGAGRWTTRDPLAFRGGDFNLYAYAGSNPVNLVDPDGEIAILPLLGAAADLGLSAADIAETAQTLRDPCASGWDKFKSAGLTAAGILLPGAGYNKADDAARRLDDLVEEARRQYPKKAYKYENHHIHPKYLRGDPKGETVRIDAAYHQLITNAFRDQIDYGADAKNASAARIADAIEYVYAKYPLPPH